MLCNGDLMIYFCAWFILCTDFFHIMTFIGTITITIIITVTVTVAVTITIAIVYTSLITNKICYCNIETDIRLY